MDVGTSYLEAIECVDPSIQKLIVEEMASRYDEAGIDIDKLIEVNRPYFKAMRTIDKLTHDFYSTIESSKTLSHWQKLYKNGNRLERLCAQAVLEYIEVLS